MYVIDLSIAAAPDRLHSTWLHLAVDSRSDFADEQDTAAEVLSVALTVVSPVAILELLVLPVLPLSQHLDSPRFVMCASRFPYSA